MENMTASNPAVAESPAVGASGSDAANATAAPTLTYATFGEALTAANSTELGNLTILVAALNATGAHFQELWWSLIDFWQLRSSYD